MEIRVGLGHDTHRLAPGRALVVGGVRVSDEFGPVGHSDGDVLLHALTDALLGAAGLGDIGQWFPDTDPQWSQADSSLFVAEAVRELGDRGWRVVNLDSTVLAERPKIGPYRDEIRSRLAELLSIAPDAVNVKAKTGEQVGPIGRGEAIAADAVVLIRKGS